MFFLAYLLVHQVLPLAGVDVASRPPRKVNAWIVTGGILAYWLLFTNVSSSRCLFPALKGRWSMLLTLDVLATAALFRMEQVTGVPQTAQPSDVEDTTQPADSKPAVRDDVKAPDGTQQRSGTKVLSDSKALDSTRQRSGTKVLSDSKALDSTRQRSGIPVSNPGTEASETAEVQEPKLLLQNTAPERNYMSDNGESTSALGNAFVTTTDTTVEQDTDE